MSSDTAHMVTCPRCEGRGRREPAWPVGPGGARLNDYKCFHCDGTGRIPVSRPVMNSPADEAEARDRANAAPSQADPDAGCRGVSGLTSGSEARPVTPTAHHLTERCPQMMNGIGCSKPSGHAGAHEFSEDFL